MLLDNKPAGAVSPNCRTLRYLFVLAVVTIAAATQLVLVAQTPHRGIWISRDEVRRLPMSGIHWENLLNHANRDAGMPDLSDQNQWNNVYVLAKALVYARTGEERYRQEVIQQCMAAIGTEGGLTLALGRELAAYVIAADLVGLPPAEDQIFSNWLRELQTKVLTKRTLISTHEDRPNNWGTHAGASRMAVAVYLGDSQDLSRAAKVFKGWLGDRSSWSSFEFQGITDEWQADVSRPVPVNPKGTTKNGHSIDGVVTDDQSRSGGFVYPFAKENYAWEALQGSIVQAVILYRHGYPDVFKWEDKAMLRVYQWLYTEAHFPGEGNHSWQLPLIDYYYSTSYWDGSKTYYGKNMGWTSWTHAERGGGDNGNSDPVEEKPKAATVSSFTPLKGPEGTVITVRGGGFGTARTVTLGALQVKFNVISDSSLSFTVPQSASDGRISISNQVGSGTSGESFSVIKAPTLSSFSPETGAAGTIVEIRGSNLGDLSRVSFSGVRATFSVRSDSLVRAEVPSNAKTGQIEVTNSAGSDTTDESFQVGELPVLSSFTPGQGSPGTEVTITGSNFSGATDVSFGGATAVYSVGSDSKITATIPSSAKTGPITVKNSYGDGMSKSNFTILGTPKIVSFTPSQGAPGTSVTIRGENLEGLNSVSFNGIATEFLLKRSSSTSEIVATVPTGSSTGPISIANSAGKAVTDSTFKVLIKPSPPVEFSFATDQGRLTVSRVSPTSGRIGTRVTISGKNLSGVTGVAFNGVSAQLEGSPTASQVIVTVPAGAASGPVSLSDGQSATAWIGPFQVKAAAMTQTYTFNPSEDARISGSQPSKNFGTSGDLRVKAGDNGLKSLVKFTLTGMTGQVVKASLRLHCINASETAGFIVATSNSWSEGTVTWSNAPKTTGTPLPAAGKVDEGAWAEFDITQLVSGNGTLSVLIDSQSSDTVIYDSRERSGQPELVVETQQ